MAKAGAQIEITASSSRLVSGLAAAHAKFSSFAGSVARGMGRAFKSINTKLQPGETAKRAVGNFAGDIMGRGMDAVVGAAQDVREFESNLQRLGIATHQTPAQMQALARSMDDTSRATAVSRGELMQAASVYFDLTSDTAGMTTAMGTFAKTAQASGAGMEELVRTAAAAGGSMGIASSEFESMFSGLIKQGEAGQITLKELASEAPSLMAMFSKFGKGRQGVMEMNAAFQVGAKAFGSASQAATGLEAMMGMLQARQKQLGAAGVQVYQKNKDGTVTLRNLSQIIDDIRKKNIDPRKFGKIFGENKEGRAFMEKLIAMPDLYRDIVAAGGEAGAVQEYALARAESKAGRLDLAINNMKESIAAAFTPERIEGFTRGVEALAEKLGPIVGFVGQIGDKLGGLVGVGQSIRGFLSGNANNNPWAESMLGDQRTLESRGKFKFNSVGMMQAGTAAQSPTEAAGRMKAAQLRLANRAAYDQAVTSIMGGEVNERTSKESIKRAYLASMSDRTKDGGLGANIAGERYLEAAGLTKAQAGEAYTKEVVAALEANAKAAQAIADRLPGSVQLGDNQVARSVDKATDARRSP